MKKYFFGALAVVLAIGFSAFTTANKAKPTSLVRFQFTGNATIQSQITASSGGVYTKWANLNTITCTASADEKACVIDVDPKYVNDDQQLNAIDPAGDDIRFPMDSELGATIGSTNYYRVSTSEVANEIDVTNAVAP